MKPFITVYLIALVSIVHAQVGVDIPLPERVPVAILGNDSRWAFYNQANELSRYSAADTPPDDGLIYRAPFDVSDKPEGAHPAVLDFQSTFQPAGYVSGPVTKRTTIRCWQFSSRDEFWKYLDSPNRPVILNWIEDWPRLLATSWKLWGRRPEEMANELIVNPKLNSYREDFPDEFVFRRQVKDFEERQQSRRDLLMESVRKGQEIAIGAKLRLILEAELGEYDFDKQSFSLKTGYDGAIVRLNDFWPDIEGSLKGLALVVMDGKPMGVKKLPIQEEAAETLRNSAKKVIIVIDGCLGLKKGLIEGYSEGFTSYSGSNPRIIQLFVSNVSFYSIIETGVVSRIASFEMKIPSLTDTPDPTPENRNKAKSDDSNGSDSGKSASAIPIQNQLANKRIFDFLSSGKHVIAVARPGAAELQFCELKDIKVEGDQVTARTVWIEPDEPDRGAFLVNGFIKDGILTLEETHSLYNSRAPRGTKFVVMCRNEKDSDLGGQCQFPDGTVAGALFRKY